MAKKMAWGGSVSGVSTNAVPTNIVRARTNLPLPPSVTATHMPLNPVTYAKRMNGVPGMKKGGKVKKK